MNILEQLKNEEIVPNTAFLSGSRAFGTHTPESDHDICIPIHCRDRAIEGLPLFGESLYNNGFTATFYGEEVNIIPLHPLDMICWYLATQEMKRLCGVTGVKERMRACNNTHGVFESLRAIYKTTIPYDGAEKAKARLIELQDATPASTHAI